MLILKKTCLLTALVIVFGCKKPETDPCVYEKCDPRKKTVKTATNTKAVVSVLDSRHPDIWVLVSEEGIIGSSHPTYDGPDIVVPCNLPDSLKVMGQKVLFSGELKPSCDDFEPGFSIIYYSNLQSIKTRRLP